MIIRVGNRRSLQPCLHCCYCRCCSRYLPRKTASRAGFRSLPNKALCDGGGVGLICRSAPNPVDKMNLPTRYSVVALVTLLAACAHAPQQTAGEVPEAANKANLEQIAE